MERYYFGVTGVLGDTCTEKCMVRNAETMIGSASCQECEFLVEKGPLGDDYYGPEWIVCSRIEEATKGK